jgi:hypothetical protein
MIDTRLLVNQCARQEKMVGWVQQFLPTYYTFDMPKYKCPSRQKTVNVPYEIDEID